MKTKKITAGWREWVELPELGIKAVKAKLDTGARTSALHVEGLETFRRDGVDMARFVVHPVQRGNSVEVACEAEVIDRRRITDSGGHRENRCVIRTVVRLNGIEWPIELTLAARDTMRFRMLLGRTAMRGRVVVDPSKSFLAGKELAQSYARIKE